MGWIVLGEELKTADVNGVSLRVTQKFTPRLNYVLRATRVFFIAVGDPAFTAITFKILSDRGGTPGAVIATSTNSTSKAEIMTEDHGIYSFYQEWDDVNLRKDETYHIVPFVSGYTYAEHSLLLWKLGWPSCVYQTGVDQSFEALLKSPYEVTFVGARL